MNWRVDFKIAEDMPAWEITGGPDYPIALVGPSPANWRRGPRKKRWGWEIRERRWNHDRGIMAEGHASSRRKAKACAEAVFHALYPHLEAP